jgi:glycosyltransferase involved in cell wall biosynthesis
LAGGSERYAWEFATALSEAGARVDFLTSRDAHQDAGGDHDGIRVRRGGTQFTFYPWAAWQLLRRRLMRRSYDVVIDAENGIPVFSPLLTSRRSVVILVMHHVHQEQFRTYFPPTLAWLGRWLEAWLMPRVYRHVPTLAVSESTRHEMAQQLGWDRPVEIVHNGADVPTHVGGRPDPDRLVVLGRLATHKRIDLVIRAIGRLVAEYPSLHLDIVGKGPEEGRLRALVAELGLGEHVRLHGFLDEDDKHRILGLSSFHICASDAEGWGQVVIEAAAYGLPTLARDVPGLRDSIRPGETGWLVDTAGLDEAGVVNGLVAGIREAHQELEDDASREAYATASRAWADGFSWKRMHDLVVRVVNRELASRGR